METRDFEQPFGAIGSESETRTCDWPGCALTGEHRAPLSRERIREFQWFCLDHVRIYNRTWSYYEGLSEAEIESCIRSDTIWNRPSWPLGVKVNGHDPAGFGFAFGSIHDPLNLLGPDGGIGRPGERPATAEENRALSVMGLSHPATAEEVRDRYKILVKRHHPDRNGGDKTAEEKLKRINQAYEIVKSGTGSA